MSFVSAFLVASATLVLPAPPAEAAPTSYQINAGGSRAGSFRGDHTLQTNTRGDSRAISVGTINASHPSEAGHNVPQAALRTGRELLKGRDLTYRLPIANGTYDVTVHLAEFTSGARAGSRKADLRLENRTVQRVDAVALAGSTRKAVAVTHSVRVTDGALDLALRSVTGRPLLSAIEVSARGSGQAAPTPTASESAAPAPAPSSSPAPAPTSSPAPAPTSSPAPAPTSVPNAPSNPPSGSVRLKPSMNLQAEVDRRPAGTTFWLEAGVYRNASIEARTGDRFIGARGAIMSGAVVLPKNSWTREGSYWWIGGQNQQGWATPQHALARGGNARHLRPEMLFVDNKMWEPVSAKSRLTGSGTWFLDYGKNRIYLKANPTSLRQIEASKASYAIEGENTKNVTIQNITFEKYASRSSHGAIHAHNTANWTITQVTSRLNHGAGITVGPGTVIEGSKFVDNGQIGIVGYGIYRQGPNDGRRSNRSIAVRNTEIARNGTLDYLWTWEGGGTKFKEADGMVFENNWSHHNDGPGIWWDVFNRNVTIRRNLVEDNTIRGIMYELSYGKTVITDNVVRNNGAAGTNGFTGSQIYISASTGVEVKNNTVSGGTRGIMVRNDGNRRPRAADIQIHDNDISMINRSWSGMVQVNGQEQSKWTNGSIKFSRNTFRTPAGVTNTFYWKNTRISFAQWKATVNGAGSKLVHGGSQPGRNVRIASRYGAR